ncbi:MAG: hypothetical protein ABSB13_03890 [Candidatus Binatus sp.]|jgi:hypothetical protein
MACIELARYASVAGVSFRILADGTIETDSVEDALKLRTALLRQEARRQLPDPDDLPLNAQKFLFVIEANPSGLTSEEISKKTDIPTKSVPPLIRGLGYWATRHGFKLDKLLVRKQSFEKGKPISTYTLTVEGRRKFQKFLKQSPLIIHLDPPDKVPDFDPFEKKRGTLKPMDEDELLFKAAQLKNVRWTRPNQSFVAPCPINSDHKLAASLGGMKCLGGCTNDAIAAFFAKQDDE